MKKTKKWPSCLLAAFTVLSFVGCEDWGKADPPAANQIYPRLEQVSKITFDDASADEPFDPSILNYIAYEGGETAMIEANEELGSNVLHMANGYARMFNPLSASSTGVQNGVSLTFWVKQALFIDEETEEALPSDLDGALFSFQNENGTQRMYMTANGYLVYEGVDGEYSTNNPEDTQTGMLLPAGEWHYVAVCVRNDGYNVHVDGYQRINMTETNFDFTKIVQFMGNTSFIYFGYGSDTPTQEMWMDDITIYRNQIGSSEQAVPGNGGSGDNGFVYPIATKATIGASDCTSGWWTEFSDYYTLQPSTTLHWEFTNYTSGGGNWNNWNLCVSTNAERNADGYAEYFVIRSDLYGWGDSNYNAANWSNEGYPSDDAGWATFRTNMQGAKVTIDLVRSGSNVTATAIATCTNGTVYKEVYQQECGDGTQNINAFLIVDASYLVMDTETTQYEDPIAISKTTVGTPDCSTAWWTEFSDYFTIRPNSVFEIEFTNHTSGANNWNNWNLCVSSEAERNGTDYTEYFVIRSDLYGWGDSNYNGTNWTSEGYGDWDKFRVDMEGAKVTLTITRSEANVSVTAVAECTDGTVYKETYQQDCGDGTQNINAFLIVDGSYLEMDKAKTVTKAFQ